MWKDVCCTSRLVYTFFSLWLLSFSPSILLLLSSSSPHCSSLIFLIMFLHPFLLSSVLSMYVVSFPLLSFLFPCFSSSAPSLFYFVLPCFSFPSLILLPSPCFPSSPPYPSSCSSSPVTYLLCVPPFFLPRSPSPFLVFLSSYYHCSSSSLVSPQLFIYLFISCHISLIPLVLRCFSCPPLFLLHFLFLISSPFSSSPFLVPSVISFILFSHSCVSSFLVPLLLLVFPPFLSLFVLFLLLFLPLHPHCPISFPCPSSHLFFSPPF